MKLSSTRLWSGVFLAFFCFAVPANAQDFHLLQLEGKDVKWGQALFGTPVKIRYAFTRSAFDDPGARNCSAMDSIDGLAAQAGISEGRVEQEAAAAFADWQAVAGVSFEKIDDPQAADLVIGVQRNPRGYAFTNVRTGGPGPAVVSSGKTQDRGLNLPHVTPETEKKAGPSQIAPIAKALICFNPERAWKVGFDGNSDAYDIRYTFLHEIGHAIGLDHVVKRQSLMNFKYTEAFRAPQKGDVEGARLLYGPPVALSR